MWTTFQGHRLKAVIPHGPGAKFLFSVGIVLPLGSPLGHTVSNAPTLNLGLSLTGKSEVGRQEGTERSRSLGAPLFPGKCSAHGQEF